jgi:hypothetical protein
MAAATADRLVDRQPAELCHYSGASGYKYYKGCLVIKPGDSTLPIQPLTAAGSSDAYFLGVIANRVDLSAGLGSSNEILDVWKRGEFTYAANGTGASAHIGLRAYALDDQTVGISMAVPSLCVGEITGIVSTSKYRVRIDNAVGTLRGVSNFSPNY